MKSESEASARTSSSKSNGFVYSSPRMIEVGTVESLTHGPTVTIAEDYGFYSNDCSEATPDEDPQSPSR
jgi:hypothetical protein